MANNAEISKTVAKRIERKKQELLKILPETPIIATACRKADVSRATYYRWLEEDKVFAKEIETALTHGREFGSDMAESVILGKIAEKDLGAAKYFLEHNNERYMPPERKIKRDKKDQHLRDVETTETQSKEDGPILREEIKQLTREYNQKLREIYASPHIGPKNV